MAEDQGERLDAAGRHQLDRIQTAVRQMWELIESLVEFSRIGRKAVKMKTVDLDQALKTCMTEMRREIETSGAEIETKGELGQAEADPSLLKIALCNLISNAIKYVDKGVVPHLEISALRGAGESSTAVPRQRNRLARGRPAENLHPLRAPARRGRLSRARLGAFGYAQSDRNYRRTIGRDFHTGRRQHLLDRIGGGRPAMRILIVDDNPDHRELVGKVSKAYPQAEIVEIPRQSVLDERLHGPAPDLVLTDYRLHWSDGLRVLEQVKSAYPETPVIMVTDTGSEEVAAAGMKGGLADYILKDHLQRLPIAIRESLEKIRTHEARGNRTAELIREQAARAEAEAGERRYRSLAEAIPQIVATADAGGRFDYYNQRWFDYSGLDDGESFEHDAWKHILHEEDIRKPTLARWRGAVQSGEGYEIECRFRRASDGAFRWHLCRAIPVRNPDGGIAKWFGTCTDIDDQKRSGEALREAQKLESIGLLAGGVAHDFNNLLTGILGNASLMLEIVPAGHSLRSLLENVVLASERAADLTRQLLAYSGKGRYFVETVDLSQVVREIGSLIQSSIPKKVELRLELAENLPPVEVDPAQIRQLVMNLVINGAEAIGEDQTGKVMVSTWFQPVDEVYLERRVPLERNRTRQLRRPPRGRHRLRHGGFRTAAHLRSILHYQVHRARLGIGGRAGNRARTSWQHPH